MVYAALDISNPDINPLAKFKDIGTIINPIVSLLFIGAGLVFFVMFLYGAITVITAGGNADQFKKAQKTFQYSIIGLVIVIVSYLIVRLIGVVFNINIFQPQF